MTLISKERKEMEQRISKEVKKEIAINWAKAKVRDGEDIKDAITFMNYNLNVKLTQKEILNFS